jgi:hypothetical protein
MTAAPAAPVSLDDVERFGASRFGHVLRKLVMIHEDGRRVVVELPACRPEGEGDGDANSDKPLTKTQLRILSTLANSPVAISKKQTAHAMHREPNGSFGVQMRDLIGRGLVLEREGVVTDDAEKFAND